MNGNDVFVFFVGLVLGFSIGIKCLVFSLEKQQQTAIKLGHAQYAVYENGKTEFCWKERGDK